MERREIVMRLRLPLFAVLTFFLGCASSRRSPAETVELRARADTVEAIVAAFQSIRADTTVGSIIGRELGILVYTESLRPMADAVAARLQLPVFGRSERFTSRPGGLRFGAPRAGVDGTLVVPVSAVRLRPSLYARHFDCALRRVPGGWRVKSCLYQGFEIS